jgi:hypothetical protein
MAPILVAGRHHHFHTKNVCQVIASVGTGRRSAPQDDDCKDIDFGFDSKSDLC